VSCGEPLTPACPGWGGDGCPCSLASFLASSRFDFLSVRRVVRLRRLQPLLPRAASQPPTVLDRAAFAASETVLARCCFAASSRSCSRFFSAKLGAAEIFLHALVGAPGGGFTTCSPGSEIEQTAVLPPWAPDAKPSSELIKAAVRRRRQLLVLVAQLPGSGRSPLPLSATGDSGDSPSAGAACRSPVGIEQEVFGDSQSLDTVPFVGPGVLVLRLVSR